MLHRPHKHMHKVLTCCWRYTLCCADSGHRRWLWCHRTSPQPAGRGCWLRNPRMSHNCDSGRHAPATAQENTLGSVSCSRTLTLRSVDDPLNFLSHSHPINSKHARHTHFRYFLLPLYTNELR